MALTATIGTTVDEVLALVDELDEITYGVVDLRTHALRCAHLALEADAHDDLVTAAVLHDIGRARYLAKAAPGIPHEEVGRRFDADRFRDRAAWLVGEHVVARRYLATVDPGYVEDLTRGQKSALERQGGRLTTKQTAAFESHEWAGDAVTLRRWDDLAAATEVPACRPADVTPALGRSWALD